ncbi:MAG: hypothetical protein KDD44_03370, partial [Bdellovibrionales bacterium]|nr:hypothetical protein [Bdellovibrionales bacterium]
MPTVSFSGIASGIDGDAVIKALTDAKAVQKLPLENKRQAAEDESDGIEELQTKLLAFRDTLNDFLTLSGGAIIKSATSSDDDAVSVSASNNAPTSATTITSVSQLAKAATLSFDDRFSSATDPLVPALGGSTTISITLGTGASAQTYDVDISATTTLAELASDI